MAGVFRKRRILYKRRPWIGTSAAVAQSLTPDLFTNTQTFFGPTVSATYALTPDLFTNTQTFYGPTVTQDGGNDAQALGDILDDETDNEEGAQRDLADIVGGADGETFSQIMKTDSHRDHECNGKPAICFTTGRCGLPL